MWQQKDGAMSGRLESREYALTRKKFIGALSSDYPASKLKEIKFITYKLLRPGMRKIDSISYYTLLPRLKKKCIPKAVRSHLAPGQRSQD